MSGVFEHSIKVPRLYKTVSKIVQTVREDGGSLKQLVYLKKHPNIKALYALALTCLQNGSQLDHLIRRTKILVNEPRLDPWLARVLITELIWGKKHLSSECKPVKTVISYEKLLKAELKNIEDLNLPGNKSKVEKPRYVRVNTLVMSVEETIASLMEEGWRPLYRSENYTEFIEAVSTLSGSAFIQDIHIPELLIFPPKTQFYNHPGYTSGAIILQDKASCLPAYLLAARPGSTVLDMCASPGMKTTHLAAMLQNEGKIYAVEIDKRRYETLCEIVQSTNSYCVETINADVMTLDAKKCPNVEYILVDPSCSGSGMLDRLEVEVSSNEKCAPGRLRNLQSFQVIVLRHALLNFPTVKRVVYSTCSIYAEENEQVVDEVLSQIGDSYKLISAKSLMNNNWLNYSSTEFVCKDNCLYARSETDLSNGFFVAVFERNFDVPLPDIRRKKRDKKTEEFNRNDDEKGEEFNEIKNEKNKEEKLNGENNLENENAEGGESGGKRDKKKKKNKKKKVDEADNQEEKDIGNNFTEGDILNRSLGEDDERVSNNIDKNNCGEKGVATKKKKKSKRNYENDDVNETAEDNDQKICEDIDETFSTSTKKKKKCKKSRYEHGDSDFGNIIEENNGEQYFRKKKKSKEKSERNNDLVDVASGIEETTEEAIKKKKRKKE